MRVFFFFLAVSVTAGTPLAATAQGVLDIGTFWSIIEDANGSSDAVETALQQLDPVEIEGFESHLYRRLAESYTQELWGAAYLLHSGCSDDCFDYFRAWLISQGRSVYYAVLRDPDALANFEFRVRDTQSDWILGVAPDTYLDVTGEEMPMRVYRAIAWPALGAGWDFDDPDQMRARYPRLTEKYGR